MWRRGSYYKRKTRNHGNSMKGDDTAVVTVEEKQKV